MDSFHEGSDKEEMKKTKLKRKHTERQGEASDDQGKEYKGKRQKQSKSKGKKQQTTVVIKRSMPPVRKPVPDLNDSSLEVLTQPQQDKQAAEHNPLP